jgi:hypothetical protein
LFQPDLSIGRERRHSNLNSLQDIATVLKITCLRTRTELLGRAIRQIRGSEELYMPNMPIWDKAALFHDTQAFIEHLQRLEAQGCRWLVVPLSADESSGSFKCSKCNSDTDLAALYSIATHVAFEEEVLRAIEASGSQAEYDDQVSRIIEEEGTPMVCTACCPRGRPHRHDMNHAF